MNAAWILAIALLGQAAPAADAALEQQVKALVAQLDAGTKAERDAVERSLLDLGTRALGALPDADAIVSVEARMRIKRIRNTLEKQLAESATRASRVTLIGKEIPFAEAIASIEQQTGNRIVDYREQLHQEQRDPRLTLNLKDVEFWRALDAVLDQAHMTTYRYGQMHAIQLVSQSHGTRLGHNFVCYSGPFRIAALQVEARRDLQSAQADALKIALAIEWEPRIQPQEMVLAYSAGQTKEREVMVAAGACTAVDAAMVFSLPPRDTKQLDVVAGMLDVSMLAATAEFRFPHVIDARSLEKTIGATTVRIERGSINDGNYTVRMTAEYLKPGDALESYRGWYYANPAWLESPRGERTAASRSELTLQLPHAIGFDYTFPVADDLDDYTFVYRTPTAILKTTVPFEFKDLPLP
ncbi:MAG TPA: hypothetical protein VG713_06135 [Pirellulales bacterium]|nr:hypothetical protein [Pirellulales bacterium]